MAYFYFDFRDVRKQSRGDLLRSLLIQMSASSDPFCDILSRLYVEYGKGTQQPSDRVLTHCLKEMLTLPNQCPVYLIFDALDECPNTSGIPTAREQVLDLVKELVDLRLSSLHICVTSRPEVNIRSALEGLAFCSISLHDERGQNEDITKYIKSVVHSPSDTLMKRWREDDKDLVIQTLSEQADGMSVLSMNIVDAGLLQRSKVPMGILPAGNAATMPPTKCPASAQRTTCDSGRDICAGAQGYREDQRILCPSTSAMSHCGRVPA